MQQKTRNVSLRRSRRIANNAKKNTWCCSMCTFINFKGTVCQMCEIPKDAFPERLAIDDEHKKKRCPEVKMEIKEENVDEDDQNYWPNESNVKNEYYQNNENIKAGEDDLNYLSNESNVKKEDHQNNENTKVENIKQEVKEVNEATITNTNTDPPKKRVLEEEITIVVERDKGNLEWEKHEVHLENVFKNEPEFTEVKSNGVTVMISGYKPRFSKECDMSIKGYHPVNSNDTLQLSIEFLGCSTLEEMTTES